MARKISISFKETTKDIELYNSIMDMEDKSCVLKQIIRSYLDKENKNIEPARNKSIDNDVNILDF